MLTIADFSRKIIFDLNKTFPKARLQGKYVVVESNPSSVSIPVSSIYREYQQVKDYRKTLKLYVDIINDILDMGETFRFILQTDDVDFEKVKKRAWENLNKLSNILVRLDDAFNIFCLRYATDFNASFLLSDSMQKQIIKKVGRDYLFAIPSSSTLLVAKYHLEYIKIIKSLIIADKDPNRISDKIYQYKNGVFDIIDEGY